MANVLKREKQILVLKHLVEGNTIRATERLTGVHRDTIMRTLVRFGNACDYWMSKTMRNIPVRHVELDEIWTFNGKKDRKLTDREKNNPELGSQFLFLALCQDTRMILCHKIGKRTADNTHTFMADLRQRLYITPDRQTQQRPQFSTDGFPAYYGAIRGQFGGTVRHGVIIKNYSNPEVGRYAPPDLRHARRFSVNGIAVLRTICTSHVERFNLSVRTFLKRFTRLALGFSKKLDNLKASASVFVAFYNFVWRSRENGNSGKLRPTAAMQAGVTDRLWKFEDLFDAVQQADKERKSDARYAKLAAKLRGE